MSEKTVKTDDLAKALAALQDIAKGHSSRGTATTEVPSMRDAGVGAGSNAGATQVFHTSANSDPDGWAGSRAKDCGDDGAHDSIDENGTDYVAQRGGLMKSIIQKIAKGIPLSSAEASLYASIAKGVDADDEDEDEKGGFPAAFKDKAKKSKASDEDDEDDDDDMGKSLSDFASEDDSVSKGLEVSEFLAGFATVMSKSLQSMEERVVARVVTALAQESAGTGKFNKSLAEAVSRLGETIAAQAQRLDQVESEPAYAPRAVQNVQAIEKGSYGGPQSGEPLNKALVAATLVDFVERGEATAQDVLKFDSSSTLSPRLEQKVRSALSGS